MGAGWVVSHGKDVFGLRVSIWTGATHPNAPKYGDRAQFQIARTGTGLRDCIETISEAWIVKENPAYFAEANRLPNLRAALDEGKAQEWAQQAAAIAEARAALAADMRDHDALYHREDGLSQPVRTDAPTAGQWCPA
jgi:hypothetical protein